MNTYFSKHKMAKLILSSVMGISAITNASAPIFVEAKEAKFPFSSNVHKAYNEVVPLLNTAMKTKKDTDIKKALDSWIDMTNEFTIVDSDGYYEGNPVDKTYEKLKKFVYGLSEKQSKQWVNYLAEKWILANGSDGVTVQYNYLDDFIYSPPSSASSDIKKMMDKYEYGLSAALNTPGGFQNKAELDEAKNTDYAKLGDEAKKEMNKQKDPSEKLTKDSKKYLEEKKKEVAQEKAKKANEKKVLQKIESQPITDTTYKKIGDYWYKISSTYKNGKLVKQTKTKLDKNDAKYRYLYLNDKNSIFSSGKTQVISKFGGYNKKQDTYFMKNQNEESNYTLQYTVEKKSNNPYYYDTGIRVSLKKTATYDQYKDVLQQVAVKEKGYVVEDKDRIMIVVDKKPIVVNKVKGTYSQKEIENFFDSFPNVDIRILPTRIGTTESLESQLVSKKVNKLVINKKEEKLVHAPVVKNSHALLPLEEVAGLLKLSYKEDKGNYILEKGDVKFVYHKKDSKVVAKGKTIDNGVKIYKKSNVVYGDINELVKTFGYDMEWDSDSKSIILTK